MHLGYRLDPQPQLGHMQEASDWCVSHWSFCLCLPTTYTLSLSKKINWKNVLGWEFAAKRILINTYTEGVHRAGSGKRHRASTRFQGTPLSQHLLVFPSSGAVLLGSYGASSHRRGRSLTPCSAPLPSAGAGGEAENPRLIITAWSSREDPALTREPSRSSPRVASLEQDTPVSQEIMQSFRCAVARTGAKDQILEQKMLLVLLPLKQL